VRNGSVIDLQLEAGRVGSLVSGSDIYEVDIEIKPLAKKRWTDIKRQCAGQIGSLVELLQGSISKGVMEIVTRTGQGLFPSPREISLSCSCPDWATMCKHVAATLYGVGARLDHAPELLFTLRGVDATDMVETAIDQSPPVKAPRNGRVLDFEELSSVFGIDIDFERDQRIVRAKKKGAKAAKKTRHQKPGPRKRSSFRSAARADGGKRSRSRAMPERAQRPKAVKLPSEALQRLHLRAVGLVEKSPALRELVQQVQPARGRLYLWWEPGDLMARITPIEPGPLLLETSSGKSWTEIKRGRLATVLKALEVTE
jgi:uncharacterized Zn finger protein